MIDKIIEFINVESKQTNFISITIFVNYFTKEDEFEIDREIVNTNGEKYIDRNFPVKFLIEFDDLIREYHSKQKTWNKAMFTVYKDGSYTTKTWWDSEFQISLYGIDN